MKVDLVGVQELRWDKWGTIRAGDYIFSGGWMGHVACMGERKCVYRVVVGKPEGKRPLGRPRHRWEDNIKIDLQEVGCGAWIGLIWLRIGTGGGDL
jgi:hypothetical protein